MYPLGGLSRPSTGGQALKIAQCIMKERAASEDRSRM
jgi:hypothetical protein